MPPAPTAPPHQLVRLAGRWWPLLVAAVVAVLACRQTWFFCDDAFITFRYCGNAYDGRGFVWNPAPFAPVEGYTSFLWMWLLYAIWVVTGLAPPQTAIPITCACGVAVLWLVARALQRLSLPASMAPWRAWLQAAVLLGIAGNHNFATWLSSGLETMVFALWAVAWTLRATATGGTRGSGLMWLALWASLALLTRPDGGLMVLGTLVIAGHAAITGQRSWRTAALSVWPLLLPVAHLLWRRAYYGEWLPNTYYAKVTAAWPESGLRYLACFALEQGLWLWLPLAAVWCVAGACRRGALRSLLGERWPALVAVGAWLGYTGYYTLVVGGDHFAYRIFTHFVPLLFLAALAMLAALRAPAWLAGAVLVTFGVVGDAPGWWLERQLQGHEAEGFVRVVGRAPSLLRPVSAIYDRNQAWLLLHSVGHRRALHAVSCARAREDLPDRAAGQIVGSTPGTRLVWRADAVGVVGWALPDVAILDGHGLNDWVIARTRKPPAAAALTPAMLRDAFGALDTDRDGRLRPVELAAGAPMLVSVGPQLPAATWVDLMLSLGDADGDDSLTVDELVAAVLSILPPRQMAHERQPPPGYIEALRPNVVFTGGQRRVDPAVVPLEDDEVRAVEQRFRAQVQR
ncbi:MAG: hypothetical protein H6838_11625 [Planctomycetes bacterium]|nr:hypothetical protein [Planctomycetota bacterium]